MPEKNTEEQRLAEMEYSAREHISPAMYADYDVGFEEIESEDDGQTAVGVRIFAIGDAMFQAPIFFDNGKLYGQELLISDNDDVVIPFTEKWTSFIQRTEPTNIIETMTGQDSFDPYTPDFSTITDPPGYFEDMDSTDKRDGTSSKKAASVERMRYRDDPGKVIDIVEILSKAGEVEKTAALQVMDEYPKVAESLLNRHPELIEILKPAEEDEGTEEDAQDSTYEEKKKSLGQTPTKQIVRDKSVTQYTTPSKPGAYEAVVGDGDETKTILVIDIEGTGGISTAEPLRGSTERRKRRVHVWDVDAKGFSDRSKKIDTICVSTEGGTEQTQWKREVEKMDDDHDKVRRGDFVTLFGPKPGEVAYIDEVDEKIKREDGTIELIGEYGHPHIILLDSGEGRIVRDDKIYVPSSYKVVKTTPRDEVKRNSKRVLKPVEVLNSTGKPLTFKEASIGYNIEHDGNRVKVRDVDGVNEVLQDKFNLSKKASKQIEDDFRTLGRSFFMVKAAQPSPAQMALPQGQMPAQAPPGMPAGPGAAPSPAAAPPPQQQGIAPEAQKAIEEAMQAEQMGNEEAIDTSTVGHVLSVSDDAKYVSEALPDLLKAVDAIGQRLMKIYWDRERFENDVGPKKLKKVIDNMKEVFKSQGDLAMTIRENFSQPGDSPISTG